MGLGHTNVADAGKTGTTRASWVIGATLVDVGQTDPLDAEAESATSTTFEISL